MTRDEAKAKVQKLMAMGSSPTANEHEAERAMRQAAFLMKAHAIELAEIDAAGLANPIEWSTVLVPQDNCHVKTATGWLGQLSLAIAKFTDCKASWGYAAVFGMCIRLDGEIVDVEYASYLMKHLRDTVRAETRRNSGDRQENASFRRGMVNRLIDRLEKLKAEMDAELEEYVESNGGTAMVLVDQKLTLRDEKFGRQLEKKTYGSVYDRDSYHAGQNAGDKVGFGRPVGSDKRRALT